jgi:hypothetical protein
MLTGIVKATIGLLLLICFLIAIRLLLRQRAQRKAEHDRIEDNTDK